MKTLGVSSLLICSALSLSPVFAVVYTSDYELTGTETQSFSIKANAGEVVTVSAHGGISVEMAGDTFIGDMSNAGTANFVIDGSGNHISFVNAFCLENKGQAGSAVNLLISGSNNTLSAGAFIDYCGVDTTSTVSVTGSNNTLIWTGIHRGYGDIRGGEKTLRVRVPFPSILRATVRPPMSAFIFMLMAATVLERRDPLWKTQHLKPRPNWQAM